MPLLAHRAEKCVESTKAALEHLSEFNKLQNDIRQLDTGYPKSTWQRFKDTVGDVLTRTFGAHLEFVARANFVIAGCHGVANNTSYLGSHEDDR